ncbi:MAG: aminopeptidase P N-terminal domain-containing protein [Microthrixaceae bacterium]
MSPPASKPTADAPRTDAGPAPEVFAQRRSEVARQVGSDALLIVAAGTEAPRNHDVDYEFRQASQFWWLTGFSEPDAVAVLAPGHPDGDYQLFVRPRDPERETWDGYRAGVEGAQERFGATRAYPVAELGKRLVGLAADRSRVLYRTGDRLDSEVLGLIGQARGLRERTGRNYPSSIVDPGSVLDELRLRKDAADLASLRRAGALAAEGHREAMRVARPGLTESQVQGAMEWVWRAGGSVRNGYPSIVASGHNACVLHYTENAATLAEGDLVLIDAGCEVDQLSADITRTFPANGHYSGPQRALYEVVLAAQHAALAEVVPGATIRSPHQAARQVLAEGMVALGLIPESVDNVLAMALDDEFFMHGTSHWLGLDVHDVGSYRTGGEHRALAPGMSLTIEPGIYVAPSKATVTFKLLERDRDAWAQRRLELGTEAAREAEQAELNEAPELTHQVPEELLGLGIRIEDDVVVTGAGCEVLTDAVPTDSDEIEALCADSPRWVVLPG